MKMAQEDSECTWEAGVEGSLAQAAGCASQPWEHGTAAKLPAERDGQGNGHCSCQGTLGVKGCVKPRQ